MLSLKQARIRVAFFKMVEQYRGEDKRPKRRSMPAHLRDTQADLNMQVLPTPQRVLELEAIARSTPRARVVKTRAPMDIDGYQF